MTSENQHGIAIIGMGCRFPGGVESPDDLWDLLSREGDAIVDVPKERWSTERFYSDDPAVPGKTYVRRGGFLRDPIDRFDPLFFGISPREAQHMDPQQRLLLEVGWETMEDAGLVPAALAGSKTGVYVGGFALDAMTILMSPFGRKLLDTHHTATAASMTMLAARLSYIFDFRGPSVTMDTACSSSLVALHYACQGLLEGECDLALAGGVNVMLSAEYPIIMSKGHFLARDGHCKSFDAKADGYSRGEGCGIVLLKRLDDAQRDGDRIHAVVCGTAIRTAIIRDHGITPRRIVLAPWGSVFKTPSGKIQRAQTRSAYAEGQLAVLHESVAADPPREPRPAAGSAPVDMAEVEDWFLDRLRRMGIDPGLLDPSLKLTELGFDSLKIVELKADLERDLRIVIPIADLYAFEDIKGLADHLRSEARRRDTAEPPPRPAAAPDLRPPSRLAEQRRTRATPATRAGGPASL